MKKYFISGLFICFSLFSIYSQSDEELFGNSDDDLFGDDGIETVVEVKAKSDLAKGVIFDNGSIKIGGNFNTSISTITKLYSEEENSFGDNVKDSTLTPTLSALLSVDARPTDVLRMYAKFGFGYPFVSNASTVVSDSNNPFMGKYEASTSISDYFKVKELFTDFSIADTAFFRFGVHTVTWGTGYFFSPVSDLINVTSINPEDTQAQVDGCLNLRTQITFPNSQNCLWLYVIPSTSFTNTTTAESYVKDTGLAGKIDMVFGGWEIGAGGFWKYENAPKLMLTATGSLRNVSLFGEFVYRYGGDTEWYMNKDWEDKTHIIQATVGLSRYWKDPSITLAAQYYYDGNNVDPIHEYLTYGHNIAVLANFGRIFGTTDVTASLFGMINFGKEELSDTMIAMLGNNTSFVNCMTVSGTISYSPVKNIKIGMGPYVTLMSFDKKPTVSLKLTASLGGGKF